MPATNGVLEFQAEATKQLSADSRSVIGVMLITLDEDGKGCTGWKLPDVPGLAGAALAGVAQGAIASYFEANLPSEGVGLRGIADILADILGRDVRTSADEDEADQARVS